ncbi:hypothetical protein [Prochlorococcus sp. MIT 1307]|uniref:hypothetical protein n=1 Tax=Prochlorococcus sp. MIT 1307 TaxID=3096219 RepID=UPI002A7473E5|nr:hypothetical protein [Prochlorococcus sp. MIT 1307]
MEEVHLSTLDQLDQLEEILLDGNRIPFSGNRLINEQDVIDLLDEIRESIPREIVNASEILKNGDKYLQKSKVMAEDILTKAKQERNRLVNSDGVRQEAERQILELQNYSRKKCEEIINNAHKRAAKIENEMQLKISQQERMYAINRQKLEKEAAERKTMIENRDKELTADLKKRYENNNNKALEQLEKCRQESLKLKIETQKEAERINNEAILLKQQTQQQCDSLILQSRNEAAFLQEGANKYAEQTLIELESRLRELNQVVLAGRSELGKIKSIASMRQEKSIGNTGAIPLRKIRSHSSKIKSTLTGTC